jgi:7-cyano-7-deazaguanine synthase
MKTVLIYSGGMDSTILLYHLLAEGHEVAALTVDYGQRHRREIQSAREICEARGLDHEVADLRGLRKLLAGSSLTDDSMAVPDGHYAEETMKMTVVPNRNMLMISVATAWAISLKAQTVSYAAHAGDHTIYPDCRREFADALNTAMELADWQEVSLHRPFIELTKADLVTLGAELGVPFEQTWSCYKGEEEHCGRCGTCIERREAFHLAGVPDPTPYATDAPPVEQLIQTNWKPSPC